MRRHDDHPTLGELMWLQDGIGDGLGEGNQDRSNNIGARLGLAVRAVEEYDGGNELRSEDGLSDGTVGGMIDRNTENMGADEEIRWDMIPPRQWIWNLGMGCSIFFMEVFPLRS